MLTPFNYDDIPFAPGPLAYPMVEAKIGQRRMRDPSGSQLPAFVEYPALLISSTKAPDFATAVDIASAAQPWIQPLMAEIGSRALSFQDVDEQPTNAEQLRDHAIWASGILNRIYMLIAEAHQQASPKTVEEAGRFVLSFLVSEFHTLKAALYPPSRRRGEAVAGIKYFEQRNVMPQDNLNVNFVETIVALMLFVHVSHKVESVMLFLRAWVVKLIYDGFQKQVTSIDDNPAFNRRVIADASILLTDPAGKPYVEFADEFIYMPDPTEVAYAAILWASAAAKFATHEMRSADQQSQISRQFDAMFEAGLSDKEKRRLTSFFGDPTLPSSISSEDWPKFLGDNVTALSSHLPMSRVETGQSSDTPLNLLSEFVRIFVWPALLDAQKINQLSEKQRFQLQFATIGLLDFLGSLREAWQQNAGRLIDAENSSLMSAVNMSNVQQNVSVRESLISALIRRIEKLQSQSAQGAALVHDLELQLQDAQSKHQLQIASSQEAISSLSYTVDVLKAISIAIGRYNLTDAEDVDQARDYVQSKMVNAPVDFQQAAITIIDAIAATLLSFYNSFRDRTTQLRAENAQVTAALNESRENVRLLQKQSVDLQKALSDCQEQVTLMEKSHKGLLRDYNEKVAEYDDLQEKAAAEIERLSTSAATVKQLSEQLQREQIFIGQLQAALRDCEEERDHLRNIQDALQKASLENERDLNAAQLDARHARERVQELEYELNEARSASRAGSVAVKQELQQAKQEAESTRDETDKIRIQLQRQIDQLQEELKTKEDLCVKELLAAERAIAAAKDQLAQCNDEIDRLVRQLADKDAERDMALQQQADAFRRQSAAARGAAIPVLPLPGAPPAAAAAQGFPLYAFPMWTTPGAGRVWNTPWGKLPFF